MIVVIDNVMTSSARYADLVLPATSSFEESDLSYQGYAVEMGALLICAKRRWSRPARAAPSLTSARESPGAWGWSRSSPKAAAMMNGWSIHVWAVPPP
jgi:anaerobic selenocysteine-containing dehydrogenase